jgi:biotin carboxyl carrier protein
LLGVAYSGDGRTGVVKNTTSTLKSDATSYGYSTTSEVAVESAVSGARVGGAKTVLVPPPQPPAPLPAPTVWPPPMPQPPAPVSDSAWDPSVVTATGEDTYSESFQATDSYQTVSNNDAAHETQQIVSTGYGYRIPYYECLAQGARAQISLIDQKFAAFMSAQNLPNLAQVFANELNSIDGDVFRLQIAYLNTILLSPIPGIVTGVYKNPGEAVRAGEPVIRVENNAVILLEAILIFRGPISIGQTVTVTTALFGASSGEPTSITGVVVGARGQSDDDKWDVIIECDNMDHSTTPPTPIFPLGYRFDYDDTTVSVS